MSQHDMSKTFVARQDVKGGGNASGGFVHDLNIHKKKRGG